MKTALFVLLLIPALCFAEPSPFGGNSPTIADMVAKSKPPRHERSIDLTNWFILNQAYSAPYGSEPPLIIYHARDAFDATVFQMQSDIMSRGNPYAEKPRIILEIGRNGKR